MYSIESIRKVVRLINETIAKYENVPADKIKLCISKNNTKIGKVMNISLPPIITCANCSGCKFLCYDIKACLQYPSTVIDARVRNYMILKNDINDYFNRIDQAMSRRRKNKYFRFHVSGDIINLDYFSRMVELARRHSDFIIWTYTKNYSVVNEYCRLYGRDSIPENFIIMFSEWDGMPMNNPYHFPEFTCKLKDGNQNHPVEYFETLYKCPGNCDICKSLHRGCIAAETTYCDQH